VGSELDVALAEFYEGLARDRTRDSFNEALASLFRSVHPIEADAHRIFVLIQLVSAIKPPESRHDLERYLEDKAFRWITFEESPLQRDLLSARANYGVDDYLVHYIRRTSAEIDDYDYQLLCFRLLSLRTDGQPWLFLNRLLPDLTNRQRMLQLTRVLGEIVSRRGFQDLLRWRLASDDLLRTCRRQLHRLDGILWEEWAPALATVDPRSGPFERMFAAVLSAGHQQIPIDELSALAKLGEELVGAERLVLQKSLAYIDAVTGNRSWDVFDNRNRYSKFHGILNNSYLKGANPEDSVELGDDRVVISFLVAAKALALSLAAKLGWSGRLGPRRPRPRRGANEG
jgi:hypothetical protein